MSSVIPAGAVLVVSGDAAIRGDWSAQLEGQGYRVLRCVGPQIQCALTSRPSCPLYPEAGWAVYDECSVTPEWRGVLSAQASGTVIVVARDRMRSDGHHEPMLRRTNGPYVPLRWELANKHAR